MKRLLHVISFTTDIERSKAFYRDGVGLSVGANTPFMVNFAHDGGLVLLAVGSETKTEVELCFESDDVTAAVDRLRGRGIQFADELRHLAFGSVIHFRDAEGKLLSMLQPGTAARDRGSRSSDDEPGAPGERAGRMPVAVVDPSATQARLSTAIVNCGDLTAARAYYAHLLGLHVSVDSPAWVQFDTGDIQLALHATRDRNATEPHHRQPVSFGFTVPDLEAWLEGARERGVPFASAPIDHGMGLTAEVVDPEGNVVVVREPISEESLEERLAEAYEDDIPGHIAMRNPVRKAVRHASWVALRPEYKPKRAAGNGVAPVTKRERTKDAAAPRGAAAAREETAAGRARRASERLKQDESRTRRARKRPSAPAASARAASARAKPVAKKAASGRSAARRTARKSTKRDDR